MARAGQRHTTADLATALGMGYAFAVEFVELALGDDREQASHAGEENADGLHGNAVLSRWPIRRAAMIPLDGGGAWYRQDLKQGQRRVGGRNAVACEIAGPAGPFWAVAAHFESESTPDSRAAEAARIVEGLAALGATGPAVIGGDFNTRTAPVCLTDPAAAEPAFAVFAAAGFAWQGATLPGGTTRDHPWDPPGRAPRKLDWLLLRGLAPRDPWIAPALDAEGRVLSDHECLGVTLA
jgi:endonuclease/exonuclease/phosphatase family metal-dependent hydrolase